ncbi:GTPBA-like protein [Mya arenaria]|uniref:GTPBA-like protein n=1 Tax=Mya arenaria TaxID=6604 RepID=A0ABY7D929_MYAAR|nr:GTPBA-like protein [Mya arenaria]
MIRAHEKSTLEKIVTINPLKRFTAASGGNSSRKILLGSSGEPHIIPVPLGVTISTDEGRDLNVEGDEVVVANGGAPGSPENDYLGRKGEAMFPNAGKSTFLTTISRASPKIAAYPFTTLRPQIGTMMYPDHRQITVADLPGLIEGAHLNYGMGHKFLKHVERTKMLLFMVDINGFQLSQDYIFRNAFETILLLNKELELYNKDLLHKPAVIALNKIDTDRSGKLTDSIIDKIKHMPELVSDVDEKLRPKNLIRFREVYKISTKHKINTETMKERLRALLDVFYEQQRSALAKERSRELSKLQNVLGQEQLNKKIV